VVAYNTDTPANLRAVARCIREMRLKLGGCIFSGDLTNSGELESYAHLQDILAEEFEPLGVPILLGLGNHDARLPFRKQVLRQADASSESEPYYYSQQMGDLRVLMLDSKVPDRVDGLLGRQQLDWLAGQLATPVAAHDVVVLHHPSVPRGVPRPDDYLLRDASDFARVLQAARPGQVAGILCGHSHVSSVASFAGVLHVTAPATAYLLDPSVSDGGRGVEGSGFNLCTLREGRLVVNSVILPGGGRELYRHHLQQPPAVDMAD